MDAKKGDWVRIHHIVLEVKERSSNIPEDTRKVPLEMWDKGFLINEEANLGDNVQIETYIGRKVEGTLVEVNPYYKHDFGKCIPETLYIGGQVRTLIGKEDDQDE